MTREYELVLLTCHHDSWHGGFYLPLFIEFLSDILEVLWIATAHMITFHTSLYNKSGKIVPQNYCMTNRTKYHRDDLGKDELATPFPLYLWLRELL